MRKDNINSFSQLFGKKEGQDPMRARGIMISLLHGTQYVESCTFNNGFILNSSLHYAPGTLHCPSVSVSPSESVSNFFQPLVGSKWVFSIAISIPIPTPERPFVTGNFDAAYYALHYAISLEPSDPRILEPFLFNRIIHWLRLTSILKYK